MAAVIGLADLRCRRFYGFGIDLQAQKLFAAVHPKFTVLADEASTTCLHLLLERFVLLLGLTSTAEIEPPMVLLVLLLVRWSMIVRISAPNFSCKCFTIGLLGRARPPPLKRTESAGARFAACLREGLELHGLPSAPLAVAMARRLPSAPTTCQ